MPSDTLHRSYGHRNSNARRSRSRRTYSDASRNLYAGINPGSNSCNYSQPGYRPSFA